jgi:hypothetical protein
MMHIDKRVFGRRRVLAWAAAGVLAACGGGGGSGDPAAVPPPTAVAGDVEVSGQERFSNPTDPTLYAVRSASGQTFTFIGQRSTAGVPSVVTELEYTKASGERYSIEYGPNGLPARVVDAEGTVVSLAFSLGPEQSAASGAAPKATGRRQVLWIDSMVALAQLDGPAEFRQRWTAAADAPASVRSVPEFRADPAQSARDVVVRVNRCGAPANVTSGMMVAYSPDPAVTPRLVRARPTGQVGEFVATIPSWRPSRGGAGPLLNPTAREMCEGVASALGNFCTVFSPDTNVIGVGLPPGLFDAAVETSRMQVCTSVAALAGPAAPKAFATCVAGMAAGALACSTLDESFTPDPNAPSMLQRLCEAQIDRDALVDEPGQFLIQAIYSPEGEAPTLGEPGDYRGRGGGRTQRFQVSSAGPFPSLGIDLTQPWIDSLTALPAMPRSGQSYTASAEFSCASGLASTIEATRDNASAPVAFARRAGVATSTSSLQLTVPATPRGRLDTLVARVGDPSSPATGMARRTILALGDPPSDPTVPIRLTGTGKSVDSRSHPRVNGGVPVRCESTAEWTINVNPGGTFWGIYLNPRPNMVQTLGGYRCETRTTPLETTFSGTYRDGRFELRPSNYYYHGTSRLFLELQDVMVGDIEAGRMVTRPNYGVDIPPVPPGSVGDTLRIEHAFDLQRAP